ncbi:MAG TPA: DUF6458 family protein [Acidimicrobiales bacterium]|nr:DUF6458 family protein [Acidimicrobiales bacterium]
MGMGTSIFLIAIGAILAFAVDVQTEGVNLNTIGMILLIVGAIGAVLSMIFWSSWGGFGGTRVVEGRTAGRRTVVEEEI